MLPLNFHTNTTPSHHPCCHDVLSSEVKIPKRFSFLLVVVTKTNNSMVYYDDGVIIILISNDDDVDDDNNVVVNNKYRRFSYPSPLAPFYISF